MKSAFLSVSIGRSAIAMVMLMPVSAGAADKGSGNRMATVIHAVAPGKAVAGSVVRVYGREFEPGLEMKVKLTRPGGELVGEESLTVSDGHALAFVLPQHLVPGPYELAVASAANAPTSRPSPLEVVPTIVEVLAEQAPPGAIARAHTVVPGQTVEGEWKGPGDTHFYLLRAGKGAAFRMILERTDQILSPFHPSSVDPELLVADPNGFVDGEYGYAHDRSADDTNAELKHWVALETGGHLICCRTTKGMGEYRLRVERLPGTIQPSFEVLRPPIPVMNVVGSTGEEHYEFQWLLIDPHGEPAANAVLTLDLEGGHLVHGINQATSLEGIASLALSIDLEKQLEIGAAFPWPWQEEQAEAAHVARSKPIMFIRFDPFSMLVEEVKPLR